MIIRVVFLLLVSCFLSSCSGTTVVLIPNAEGKVGQVSLTTDGGTTLLSKANESARASKTNEAPSEPVILSDNKIHAMFAATLAKEPTPPERFRLYFSMGTAEMTDTAKAEIATIVTAIHQRKSCDLSVIGHSDRVGDNATNKKISLQRAETVVIALTHRAIARQCMDIRYYGENDPAVPTADNVAEALNRRVEVEIR